MDHHLSLLDETFVVDVASKKELNMAFALAYQEYDEEYKPEINTKLALAAIEAKAIEIHNLARENGKVLITTFFGTRKKSAELDIKIISGLSDDQFSDKTFSEGEFTLLLPSLYVHRHQEKKIIWFRKNGDKLEKVVQLGKDDAKVIYFQIVSGVQFSKGDYSGDLIFANDWRDRFQLLNYDSKIEEQEEEDDEMVELDDSINILDGFVFDGEGEIRQVYPIIFNKIDKDDIKTRDFLTSSQSKAPKLQASKVQKQQIPKISGIYFESQFQRLCGQHAMNNMFQNSEYTKDILVEGKPIQRQKLFGWFYPSPEELKKSIQNLSVLRDEIDGKINLFKQCIEMRIDYVKEQSRLAAIEHQDTRKVLRDIETDSLEFFPCPFNGDFNFDFIGKAIQRAKYNIEVFHFSSHHTLASEDYNPKEGEKVVGYIFHLGSKDSGHYVATVKLDDFWVELDSLDNSVLKTKFKTPKEFFEKKRRVRSLIKVILP